MNFIIFFTGKKLRDYPFTMPRFYYGYKQLFRHFSKKFPSINWFVARDERKIYNGQFNQIWQYKNNRFVKCSKPVKPDIVWNRDHYSKFNKKGDFTRINPLELENICEDKWLTYKYFRNFVPFSPSTVLLSDEQKIRQMVEKKFIVKARRGYQSRFIRVVHNKNDLKKLISSIPKSERIYYIAQSFTQSYITDPKFKILELYKKLPSNVNPQKLQGEIRVIVAKNEMIFSGGKAMEPKKEKVQKSLSLSRHFKITKYGKRQLLAYANIINKKIAHFSNRFIAIDIAINNQGQLFFYEINSIPAIPSAATSRTITNGYYKLLEKFIRQII